MKLADWANSVGVKYLTAYRWFKDGKLPVSAYQIAETGTIIVEVDDNELSELESNNKIGSNDEVSLLLKKAVEYSIGGLSISDFASYVITNFSLKFFVKYSGPKYSKIKPKPEDIQNYYKKLIASAKPELPKPEMFISDEKIDISFFRDVAEGKQITTDDLSVIFTEDINTSNHSNEIKKNIDIDGLISKYEECSSNNDHTNSTHQPVNVDNLELPSKTKKGKKTSKKKDISNVK